MYIRKIAQTPELQATVIDNLNSESSVDALSAKQGKVLNEKVDTISEVPVDTIIAYDGDEIPEGYEEVEYDDIKVSPIEPINKERVWIQRGKNLIDVSKMRGGSFINETGLNCRPWLSTILNYDENTGSVTFNTDQPWNGIFTRFITVNNIKTFTINFQRTHPTISILIWTYDKNYNYLGYFGQTPLPYTFTVADNVKYIRLSLVTQETPITEDITFSNIQLEQGSVATAYEKYVDPKIYIKDSTGAYEEFVNVKNLYNQQNYSSGEQVIGTYFDKPLYRKVYTGTTPSESNSLVGLAAIKNLHIQDVVTKKLFITQTSNNYIVDGAYAINPDVGDWVDLDTDVVKEAPYRLILEYTKHID